MWSTVLKNSYHIKVSGVKDNKLMFKPFSGLRNIKTLQLFHIKKSVFKCAFLRFLLRFLATHSTPKAAVNF